MASANVSTHYEKMSSTPIPRLVVSLAIPAIISMMVTNIYNLVDTAFVGQLGTSASGAVGIVFGFMSIIQAFGFMFGQGSGSILARAGLPVRHPWLPWVLPHGGVHLPDRFSLP